MSTQRYKTIRLITTRAAECPKELALAHRRIFSFLAYRSRLGCGGSQREISKQTTTDPRTTKNVLAFLSKRKLVECVEGQWIAKEPVDEYRKWFPLNKSPKYQKHWSDRFCYSSFLVPRKGATIRAEGTKRFTANHAHVYSLLTSLGRSNKDNPNVVERIGVSRLSKMLNGLSPKTIRSALRILESLGLILCYQEGAYETIHVRTISNAHDHLFEKVKRSSRTEKKQEVPDQQEVRFQSEELQAIYHDCRREGFPILLSKDITVAAALAGVDQMAFDGYSEQATLEHARNRMAGKVSVDHHGHLLLYKLTQVREEQDRAEERMMPGITKPLKKTTDRIPTHAKKPQTIEQQSPAESEPKQQPKPKDQTTDARPPSEIRRRISHELLHTRAFLKTKFDGDLSVANIVRSIEDESMACWVKHGWVSPFFLAVSPEVRQALDGRSPTAVFGRSCQMQFSNGTLAEVRACYDEIFTDDQAECVPNEGAITSAKEPNPRNGQDSDDEESIERRTVIRGFDL